MNRVSQQRLEAWPKRHYEAHFLSKLTAADGENGETETWLDLARDCGYLSNADHSGLSNECREIGAISAPSSTTPPPSSLPPSPPSALTAL
ncbi:MAG: four helix bundle protein [Caldilineales bacterium]|nr:four helix bundle protein [Caldilineales bacterium]